MANNTTQISAVQARINSFRAITDGWLDGAGKAPSQQSLDNAYQILTGFLTSYEVPRPCVFPTPRGYVQAEWANYKWALDVLFTDESIEMSLSLIDSGEDVEGKIPLTPGWETRAYRELARWWMEHVK